MDFDQYVDRTLYPTMKWNRSFLLEHFGNSDAIPMSVADMDLKAPAPVTEQLQRRVAHGIYGYEQRSDTFFDALESWYKARHGWAIERQHIEACPSILNAVSVLISQHSDEGQGVILQPPVFFEFKMVVRSNYRKIVKNPLRLVDGHYQMDFDDLESKASDPSNRILILCNPHNPVGRVWTKDELTQVAEICSRHDVLVISDEIHGDFAFPPHRSTPFLHVSEATAASAVACISPAKSFNMAGMVDAMAVIPDETIRRHFHDFAHRFQTNKVNVFATTATEAAYREGGDWLDALLLYIQSNVDLIADFLASNDIGVSLVQPEGTFLAWVDFRRLGLDAKELARFLAVDAGVALAPGHWFGREGAGFARMTIGCPRETVQHALDRLAVAVRALS